MCVGAIPVFESLSKDLFFAVFGFWWLYCLFSGLWLSLGSTFCVHVMYRLVWMLFCLYLDAYGGHMHTEARSWHQESSLNTLPYSWTHPFWLFLDCWIWGSLGSQLGPGISCLHHPSTRASTPLSHQAFMWTVCDYVPNSGPHVFMARTLPAKPSPLPRSTLSWPHLFLVCSLNPQLVFLITMPMTVFRFNPDNSG